VQRGCLNQGSERRGGAPCALTALGRMGVRVEVRLPDRMALVSARFRKTIMRLA
jgi:hypothetical protein